MCNNLAEVHAKVSTLSAEGDEYADCPSTDG